jgi:Fe-S-cluster-containing dehydrogenase component
MGKITRAQFLRRAALAGGSVIGGSLLADKALGSSGHKEEDYGKFYGILFDSTKCIGCRTCEKACHLVNNLVEPGEAPLGEHEFDDLDKAFEKRRRTGYSSHTVINRFYPGGSTEGGEKEPTFVKYQCMHCNYPACVSACIVGALTKEPDGPVHYDQVDCIGCRYCVVACPFQVPVYEFHDAFSPAVLKCTLCQPRIEQGLLPGCVKACPMEAMTFGRREELIDLGHKLIEKYPDKYHPEIWGEHIVGGTGWMYLLPKEISNSEEVGLPLFDGMTEPIPPVTEEIQHAIFKYFIPPIAFYGILTGILFYYDKNPRPMPSDVEEGGEAHE